MLFAKPSEGRALSKNGTAREVAGDPSGSILQDDSTPATRPGRVAAFSEDDQSKSRNLIVVFRLRKGNNPGMACEVIQNTVCVSVGVKPSCLVAIPEGGICKGLNGKIQLHATRAALLDGTLDVVYEQVYTLIDCKQPIDELSARPTL